MSKRTSNISGWPDEGVIFPVTSIDVRVSGEPHPYFHSHTAEIATNWEREVAANPALFDGRMLLMRSLEKRDGAISGECHIIPFSAFLLWRKTRPAGAALHLFGLPVIVSSDGAVIAIRMGQHTANPGRVYCAAGSLDPDDIRGGYCDIDGNMAREVLEETGLSLSDASNISGFHGLRGQDVVTLFRAYHFAETAAELIALINAHIAADPDPEIDAALAIRTANPGQHPYPPFMPPVLEWVFSTTQ
ncbi:NUDIX hydrolase [Pararhizobium sp. DWP3-4]|uniref:NUDIX hydrolase n=1 Tax=Pararhizobium sp. DWP3-4 TaxID=2804565 RepID=UPI003CEA96DC